jgi:hypothetical protein
MTSRHLTIVARSILLLAVVMFVGCNKKSSDSQPAPTVSASAPLTDQQIDEARIPVKEDYEEQARQTVTSDNLDEQVDQLEKQITSDH